MCGFRICGHVGSPTVRGAASTWNGCGARGPVAIRSPRTHDIHTRHTSFLMRPGSGLDQRSHLVEAGR